MPAIRTFIGTSAGAIICFLLALGMASSDMHRLLVSFRRRQCHSLDVDNLFDLLETWGIDDGRRIVAFLRDTLLLATGSATDMTFVELSKRTGRNLVVCTSNVTTGEHEFLCVDRTPDLSVIKALRMSFAIPLVFSPVHHAGCMYVDGGLFNNFPMDYRELHGKPPDFVDTLAISVPLDVNAFAKDALRHLPAANACFDARDHVDHVKDDSDSKHPPPDAFAKYLALLLVWLVQRSNSDDDILSPTTLAVEIQNKQLLAEAQGDAASACLGFTVDGLEFDVSDQALAQSMRCGYDSLKARLQIKPVT